VFISDDDPFTVDVERNKKKWEEKLPEAKVIVCPEQKHFNDATLPFSVVDQILKAAEKHMYTPDDVVEV